MSNAALQMSHETLEEIPDDEWDHRLNTNLSPLFHLPKAALPHMQAGASITATTSINSDNPSPSLIPHAPTKAAIANLGASLAQLLAPRS